MAGKHTGRQTEDSSNFPVADFNPRLDKAFAEGRGGDPSSNPHVSGSRASDAYAAGVSSSDKYETAVDLSTIQFGEVASLPWGVYDGKSVAEDTSRSSNSRIATAPTTTGGIVYKDVSGRFRPTKGYCYCASTSGVTTRLARMAIYVATQSGSDWMETTNVRKYLSDEVVVPVSSAPATIEFTFAGATPVHNAGDVLVCAVGFTTGGVTVHSEGTTGAASADNVAPYAATWTKSSVISQDYAIYVEGLG